MITSDSWKEDVISAIGRIENDLRSLKELIREFPDDIGDNAKRLLLDAISSRFYYIGGLDIRNKD